MATHSNTLAWEIPWTEEPGSLHPRSRKELDMTERLSIVSNYSLNLNFFPTAILLLVKYFRS